MPQPVRVETPNDREVVVIREFEAPAQLIWDCHTKPELITRWLLGPPGWSMPHCTVDLRVGGRYRYVWRNEADGSQFGSFGIHTEVVAPERMVTTERMDGLDGQPLDIENPAEVGDPTINTLTLTEAAGMTTLRIAMVFPTAEIRDMAVGSGMSDGMGMGYDRLEALLLADRGEPA